MKKDDASTTAPVERLVGRWIGVAGGKVIYCDADSPEAQPQSPKKIIDLSHVPRLRLVIDWPFTFAEVTG
jgi:hypothetical protein